MEWDLSVLFSTNKEIDKTIENIKKKHLTPLLDYRGKITEFNADQLAEFVNKYEKYQLEVNELSQYAGLQVAANSKDTEAQKLQNRISKITNKWEQKLAFVKIELGELITNKPGLIDKEVLEDRRYYLSRLGERHQYRLSEKEEVLIIEKDLNGVDQWSKLQGDLTSGIEFEIDIDGEIQTHSWSSGYGLLKDEKYEVRKAAFDGLSEGLNSQEETFAYALRNICANYTTEAQRRGYDDYMKSSLHSSHLNRDIIDAMFDVLLENSDVFHEFMELKAELIGTDKLRGEDFEAPFPFSDNRTIDWEEAKQTVIEGFTEFDPEFGKVAETMFDNNRVDGKTRPGKRAGAFCSTWYKGNTSFIMLSYNQNMDSLGTLAHEMGHAVHAHYITRNQPLLHSSMGMPLAETASEFGSLLFNLKFMREAEEEGNLEAKKAILFNMVENFMIVMYEVGSRTLFETGLYEALDNDEYLNPEKIDEIYWDARNQVFGDAIEWHDGQNMHWKWKPHYYMPSFRYYNYPYVFGEFSVLSLYAAYREDRESFTNNYKEMLKAGGSRHPEEMFKDLFGFDLTSTEFWQKGIDELRNFVEQCKKSIE